MRRLSPYKHERNSVTPDTLIKCYVISRNRLYEMEKIIINGRYVLLRKQAWSVRSRGRAARNSQKR